MNTRGRCKAAGVALTKGSTSLNGSLPLKALPNAHHRLATLNTFSGFVQASKHQNNSRFNATCYFQYLRHDEHLSSYVEFVGVHPIKLSEHRITNRFIPSICPKNPSSETVLSRALSGSVVIWTASPSEIRFWDIPVFARCLAEFVILAQYTWKSCWKTH